ncbi:hypothetical protein ACTVQD_24440 (plasmid) [Serratia marcescens]|uniref:hypothetical protein n=1 Tax=Serratia marcescens TaxID=615 RepID=UPI003FA738A5
MENTIFDESIHDKKGHCLVIGKPGSGKTVMRAVLEQCVTKIELDDVTEFKLPTDKGKGK